MSRKDYFVLDPVKGEWDKEEPFHRKFDRKIDMPAIQVLNGLGNTREAFSFDNYRTPTESIHVELDREGFIQPEHNPVVTKVIGRSAPPVVSRIITPVRTSTVSPSPKNPTVLQTRQDRVPQRQTITAKKVVEKKPVVTTAKVTTTSQSVTSSQPDFKSFDVPARTVNPDQGNQSQGKGKGWLIAAGVLVGTVALTEATGITNLFGLSEKSSLDGVKKDRESKPNADRTQTERKKRTQRERKTNAKANGKKKSNTRKEPVPVTL